MHPTLRNILVVIGGLLIGSVVNMALIYLGMALVQPPEGADLATTEGLKAAMPLMGPQHFVFPFLAHAVGTLAGAWFAVRLGASQHLLLAGIVGGFFLAGGIANIAMLPSPLWFTILDLGAAYLPMAWLGWKLGKKG